MERTELEKKLEVLTLEYLDKHSGRNNQEQSAASRELRLLMDCLDSIKKGMIALTKEQKEYSILKQSNDRMWQVLQDSDGANVCLPDAITHRRSSSVVETKFYLFIEIMDGKHNDILQRIIDNTPKR